jgi:hypothetical protein
MRRRDARRHAWQLQALGELHDISALFPTVRPRDDVISGFAEGVAAQLEGPDPRVPVEHVEAGLALLDTRERRRIVAAWARRYPDRWVSVCAAVGDVALAERTLVASAVRGAISERRAYPLDAFADLDDGALSESPCAALALVLPPPLVWERDDAILVREAVQAGVTELARRYDAAEAAASRRVRRVHVSRVRVHAARLASRLPVDRYPCAASTLANGCGEVARHEEFARAVAAALLAVYALSLGG